MKSINQSDKDGATALFAAAQNGHSEVIRILLMKTQKDSSVTERVLVDKANADGVTPVS